MAVERVLRFLVRVDGVINYGLVEAAVSLVPLFARRLAGTELPPTAISSLDEAFAAASWEATKAISGR